MFSPDGHWLAYVSDESGRDQVYVQPYPGPGGRTVISIDGGTEPMWSPDGRELFYRDGAAMMAVTIETDPPLTVGTPQRLFEGPYVVSPHVPVYDVASDGKRFLMVKQGAATDDTAVQAAQIILVQNWHQELKRLVPTR